MSHMVEHEGIIQVKPSEALEIIKLGIAVKEPTFLSGPPGAGKTSLYKQAALDLGMDFISSHPVMADPTDGKGLGFAWTDADGNMVADFLPIGEMSVLTKATRPTLWLVDDFPTAPLATQASFMRPFLERMCGQFVIPDCVVPAAAGNRRIDKSAVVGMNKALLDRVMWSGELILDVDDWCKWALANDIETSIVAHKRYRPDTLGEDPSYTTNGSKKKRTKGDMEKGPSPRSWEKLSNAIKKNSSTAIEHILCCGAVGRWAGNDYLAFKRVFMNLPNVDAIMLNPSTYQPSEDPAVNWAFCGALASRASQNAMERICKVISRMAPEYGVLAMRDCINKDKSVMTTRAFIEWSAQNADVVVG